MSLRIVTGPKELSGFVRLRRIVILPSGKTSELHLSVESDMGHRTEVAQLASRPRNENWFWMHALVRSDSERRLYRDTFVIEGPCRLARLGYDPDTENLKEIHLELDEIPNTVAQALMQRAPLDRWYWIKSLEPITAADVNVRFAQLASAFSRDTQGHGTNQPTGEETIR